MSDDLDLTRMFAETAPAPEDDAFVAQVTTRIAWRRRVLWAMPAGAAALLILAIWATWPAAYGFSTDALAGILLIANTLETFFNSPLGMITAATLLLTGALWSWLQDRTRAARL